MQLQCQRFLRVTDVRFFETDAQSIMEETMAFVQTLNIDVVQDVRFEHGTLKHDDGAALGRTWAFHFGTVLYLAP